MNEVGVLINGIVFLVLALVFYFLGRVSMAKNIEDVIEKNFQNFQNVINGTTRSDKNKKPTTGIVELPSPAEAWENLEIPQEVRDGEKEFSKLLNNFVKRE